MIYGVIFLVSVFISSVSQIVLKKSSQNEYDNIVKEYINFRVIFSYGLFFVSTFLTMYAYKLIPLSLGALLESSGYIFVPILSCIFLGEKFTKMKVVGAVLIVLGICCYTLL